MCQYECMCMWVEVDLPAHGQGKSYKSVGTCIKIQSYMRAGMRAYTQTHTHIYIQMIKYTHKKGLSSSTEGTTLS